MIKLKCYPSISQANPHEHIGAKPAGFGMTPKIVDEGKNTAN